MAQRLGGAARALVASVLTLSTAAYVACGDDTISNGEPVGSEDASSPDGSAFGEGGAHCATSADCNGGYCNAGVCCANAAAACSTGCCAEGTVCVFDRCVTAGNACVRSTDCPAGQYCETALGGGPATGPADATCATPPLPGRCVDRPIACDGGGPPGCVESCEVKPQGGPLSVRMKWQWGDGLGPNEYPNAIDVWSTPTVGRIRDANCDGKIDELDAPSVVFVSGDVMRGDAGSACSADAGAGLTTACQTGVLRLVDGATGRTVWSLARDPGSPAGIGFAGLSTAIGDIDGDGKMEIVAMTGDGYVDIVDGDGKLLRRSDLPFEDLTTFGASFGWGGGLAIADVDGDGAPEIAYGRSLFTTKGGGLTRMWIGKGGFGGTGRGSSLSTFADLTDLDGGASGMELVAGRSAYLHDGGLLWNRKDLGPDGSTADGFSAVADFNKDGRPEVVTVTKGRVLLLDAETGATVAGPLVLQTPDDDGGVDESSLGQGGPPTIADFDGDGDPDIGVANSQEYFVVRVLRSGKKITGLAKLWSAANHDLSSSVTGSTVFDFEGDGKAEVVYADECFLWVWGSENGVPVVRLAIPTTSFTATEASIVADVDGDGHADVLLPSNRANPGANGWKCAVPPWTSPDPDAGRPAWTPPPNDSAYHGLRVYEDSANGWVGTRTLWNEHTYHVTNVCDPSDTACAAGATYGSIPKKERAAWKVPWVNSFRQNVLEKGLFDAPDAVVSLRLECVTPLAGRADVRNLGTKGLPAGVKVGIFPAGGATSIAEVTTPQPLLPGQTVSLAFTAPTAQPTGTYVARILVDPANPTFRECRTDNDESAPVAPSCAR